MADLKAVVEDLGDGLFRLSPDACPECTKPLLGVTRVSANEVKFEYDNFFLIVTAEGTGEERHNFKWKRVYKSKTGGNNANNTES